jgi:hypothetical protein
VLFGDTPVVPEHRPARSRPVRVPAPRKPVAVAPPKPTPPSRLAHRPPVRPGRGELQAVPNGVPRQVRHLVVRIEQLPDGRWLFSQPKVGGWSAAARNPGEVAVAIRSAFREAQVAAYSDFRHHAYDAPDAPLHRRSKPIARTGRRCDVYSPTEWKLDPERPGVWISPKNLRFPEDRQVVQRVIAARVAAGLSPRPDPINPEKAENAA